MSTTIVSNLPIFSDSTGHGNQNHLVYAANQQRWWCFYFSSKTDTTVECKVSSGSDLTTATWSNPSSNTGGVGANSSPVFPNSRALSANDKRNLGVASITNGSTDACHLSASIAVATGTDLGYCEHIRCTFTGTNSITWESWAEFATTGTPSPITWQAVKGDALGVSKPSQFVHNSSDTLDSSAVTVNQDGNARKSTNADTSATWTTGFASPVIIDSSVVNTVSSYGLSPLASDVMLCIYDNGGAADPNDTGLRYVKSGATGTWPAGTGTGDVGIGSTTQDQNDWVKCDVSTTRIYAFRPSSTTAITCRMFDGVSTWSTPASTVPTFGGTSLKAGSGLFAATDGTDLYLFALDSVGNNAIYYVKGSTANGTISFGSWTLLEAAGSTARNYISGNPTVSNNQIGVIYTAVNGSNFDINVSALKLVTSVVGPAFQNDTFQGPTPGLAFQEDPVILQSVLNANWTIYNPAFESDTFQTNAFQEIVNLNIAEVDPTISIVSAAWAETTPTFLADDVFSVSPVVGDWTCIGDAFNAGFQLNAFQQGTTVVEIDPTIAPVTGAWAVSAAVANPSTVPAPVSAAWVATTSVIEVDAVAAPVSGAWSVTASTAQVATSATPVTGAWAATAVVPEVDAVPAIVSATWAVPAVTIEGDVAASVSPVSAKWSTTAAGAFELDAFQQNAFQDYSTFVEIDKPATIVSAAWAQSTDVPQVAAVVSPVTGAWATTTAVPEVDAITTPLVGTWGVVAPTIVAGGNATVSASIVTAAWATTTAAIVADDIFSVTPVSASWSVATPTFTSDASPSAAIVSAAWGVVAPQISIVAGGIDVSVVPVSATWAVVPPVVSGGRTPGGGGGAARDDDDEGDVAWRDSPLFKKHQKKPAPKSSPAAPAPEPEPALPPRRATSPKRSRPSRVRSLAYLRAMDDLLFPGAGVGESPVMEESLLLGIGSDPWDNLEWIEEMLSQ